MANFQRAVLCLACLLATAVPLSQSQQHDNETDRLALLSFKSMMSDGPVLRDSWNASPDACQWYGVVCKFRGGQRRVTALYLNSLNLAGTISPSLANLTFLKKLHLPENRLHGPIPQELGLLPHLQHINLSSNSLQGAIPSTLCHSSPLVNISLGNNMLQGAIPPSLSNCSRLQKLDLMNNGLTGQASATANLSKQLEFLSLSGNRLSGSIPPGIANLVNLQYLDMGDNQLTGAIPPWLGSLLALEVLRLAINSFIGTIPPSLWNLSSLTVLSLSFNKLHGSLPSDVDLGLPHLKRLLLFVNQFHGPIPTSLSNISSLENIEIDHNNFSGTIPPTLGTLQNLRTLLLNKNRLENTNWNFLTALTNCSKLTRLALGRNVLRGALPSSISNLSTTLEILSLSTNQISGAIPADIGKFINLRHLDLGDNLLSGIIPDTIASLQTLGFLDLYQNRFSGEIPESLGNLTQLSQLYFGNNSLEGSIPTSLGKCQNLELLSLDDNKLSASIPKEIFNIPRLSRHLGLSYNSFTGVLPSEVGKLRNLGILDISYNYLSGEIPRDLGECQSLEYLHLEGNSFHGPIPSILHELKGLKELSLSHNNFSGPIPEFLGSLNLSLLDLSFNDLEGEVPQRGVFANVTAFSVDGNEKLCGGKPQLNLPPCYDAPVSRKKHPRAKLIIIILAVGGVALCSAFLFGFILFRRKSKPIRQRSDSTGAKEQHTKLSYGEILKATDGFSSANLVGVGSFGSVYKATFPHYAPSARNVVAVKVLNLQQRGAAKSFIAECEALKSIRHRNLVKVLTACSSIDFQGKDFKALVFEFFSNGSLDTWLHADGDVARKLTLLQRINIAIDVACAVEYLHHHGPAPIIHCDLKPSNILLDDDMTACVGDFGLAKFLVRSQSSSIENTSSSINLRGTIGYVPPEYGIGNEVSTHGDEYSYGILLLEMFTGRRPTDPAFKDGLNLHKFVDMAFPDRVTDIIDPFLIYQEQEIEDGNNIQNTDEAEQRLKVCRILSLLEIGIRCSKESPAERMEINDITKGLYAIRDKLFRVGVHHQQQIQLQ